ncbi:PAS domain S-box protein [Sphingomonas sp.]|uniref:PAS domain S-box protein n=1 Tax=Sphingomonas sp. TaxID=28214 RepID=UPI003B39FCF5
MLDHAELMRRQQVLADFGDLAIRSEDLDEVLTEACRLVGEALGTGRAKVLEIQEGRQELFVRAGVGWAPDVVGTVRLPMSERSSETYANKAAEPVISQDIAAEERFDIPDFMKKAGVVALVNVPIFVPGKRPYGVLQVDATEPRRFGDDHIQFLRTYANILGPVIDRLHLLKERTEVRERLRSSEERHRLLVESWAQAVWETDADGLVVADSPSWRAYTGQTLDEWLGYGWLNAIHPDDRAYAERQWRAAVAHSSLVNAEFRLRAPDGGWRWTNFRAAPVLDAEGRIEKWAGMNIDIEARRQAEAALRESEDRYRTLFESMDEGYLLGEVLFDDDGTTSDIRFLQANSAAIRIAGRDFTGQRMREIDPDYEQYWYDVYARVALTGEPLRAEHYAKPHGRWFDFQLSKVGAPQSRYVACIFEDITERKDGERALRESEQALASDLASAERLRSLSERLVPEESLQSIYDEILSATLAIARADAGTVQIYDPATKSLKLIASRHFSRTITDYFHRVDASSRTACGVALKTGECAFADFSEEVADLGCQLLAGEGIQSAVAYPLMSRTGTPLGMLNAHWRQARHRPNERELRFLGLLARQAADLIEQWRSQSALRGSEERQRALIEGVPQLVWRASEPGQWTWASPQWTELTGQREEDSRGWGWLEQLHPDDRAAAREAWAHATDAEALEIDYRICAHGAGSYRWFQTRAMPLRNDKGAIVEGLGTSTDVHDLRELQERQRVLVAELQHRTRNLMGVVRSMADKTARASADLPDFRDRFRNRLEALSRAQGLLSRLNDHDRVTFDELIETELAAMGSPADRVRLHGPKGVRLRSSTVQTLAMALHELATNAVKYGALGQANGQLAVTWRLIPEEGARQPRLSIDWRENGVDMASSKAQSRGAGQGRELIEKALPYQLSAKTSYELGPDGVHCTISIPISATSDQGFDHA